MRVVSEGPSSAICVEDDSCETFSPFPCVYVKYVDKHLMEMCSEAFVAFFYFLILFL